MNKLLSILLKSVAGFLFVGLLAVNVQVGSVSGMLVDTDSLVKQAKANCPISTDWCGQAEFPNGEIRVDVGDPIVVTPKEAK